MACNFPRIDELRNYIKNGKNVPLFTTPNPTQQEISEAMDYMNRSMGLTEIPNINPKDKGDDKRRYTVMSETGDFFTDAYLEGRVSDKTNKLFKKGKTEEEVNTIRENPSNIIYREYGSTGHALAEELAQLYYNNKIGRTYPKNYAGLVAEYGKAEYPFKPEHVASLNNGVKAIIDRIFAKQRTINPDINPVIKFEQFVGEPSKDIGGTMDIIAIYSDSTSQIFDYKFMSAKKEYITGTGANRKLSSDRFIHGNKKDAWKLQLGTYKPMAIKAYKLKDILSTEIVPVWLDIQYDSKGKPIKSLNKIQIGKEQSKYLKTIHATYAKTGIGQIDEFLTNRYREIEILKERIKKASPDAKGAIRARIQRIEDAVIEFLEEKNIERLVDDVIKTIIPYNDRLNSGVPIEEGELNDVIDYAKFLVNFEHIFGIEYDLIAGQDNEMAVAIKKAFNKKYGDVTLRDKVDEIAKIYGNLVEYRKQLILDNAGIKDENNLKGDDFFTTVFLPMSEAGDKIVQFMQSKFSETYENTRQDLQEITTKITEKDTEVDKWLRSRGEFYNDLAKYFWDEKGNLHAELSTAWKDAKKEAKSSKDIGWFLGNMRIKDKNWAGETYQEWYIRNKADYEQAVKDEFNYLLADNPDKYYDTLNEKFDQWEKQNNLALDSKGVPVHKEAWFNSVWLVPTNEAKLKYRTKEYQFIQDNKALKEYYDLIVEQNEVYQQIIGYDVIDKNFLPKVRADIFEKLKNGGVSSVFADIKATFEIRQDTDTFGELDEDGNIQQKIPIFFTQPFLDAEGNVDLTNQSKDIRQSLILFAKLAYSHKYMSQIEATVLAAKEVQASLEYNKTNAKGQRVFDFMHNIAKKDKTKGTSMTEQLINNAIDYHLYGIKVQPFNEDKTLTNNILKAQRYLSLKALGLGFIPGTAGYVAARVQAWVEGKKGMIYTSKQWDRATRLQVSDFNKYHAMAYFFGFHNDDMLQQINMSDSKGLKKILGDQTVKNGLSKYINARLWMRPFSYLDERLDNHIAVSMAQNYGVDANGNLKRLIDLPEGAKTIWELFNYSKDEVSFDTTLDNEGLKKIITQFKNAVRAGQGGIKGTMSGEDINYAQTNLVLKSMMQFKSWMPRVINERFGKLKYNEILASPQMGRYRSIWGEAQVADNANSVVYILKTTANMLSYIAKDLITFAPLFRSFGNGDIKVDESKARLYYSQFLEANPDTKLTFEDFLKVKKASIRAALIEVQIFLALTALIFAMGADWDDDGKPLYKDNWFLHKAYQIINRAKTELQFTLNPFEYAKVINNPFPIASLATDVAKFLGNTTDEFLDKVTGRDDKKDKTDIGHYTLRFFPGIHQTMRVLNLTEQDEKATR